MSRWMMTLICLLALAVSASAQMDDLDALLAGLGDEPIAEDTLADVEAPADTPAPSAEVAEPAVEDPFADLLGDMPAEDIEPAEALDEVVEETAEELPADVTAEDPFADLLGDMPTEDSEAAEALDEAVEDAAEELPADVTAEDPFADLLGDMPAEETEPVVVFDEIEEDIAVELPAESSEADPFADLLGDLPADEFADEPADADEIAEDIIPEETVLDDTEDALEETDPLADLLGDESADAEAPAVVAEEAPEVVIDEDASDEDAAPEVVIDEDVAAEDTTPKAAAVKKAKDKQDDEKPKRKLKPKVADKSPEWNDPVLW